MELVPEDSGRQKKEGRAAQNHLDAAERQPTGLSAAVLGNARLSYLSAVQLFHDVVHFRHLLSTHSACDADRQRRDIGDEQHHEKENQEERERVAENPEDRFFESIGREEEVQPDRRR